MKIMLIINPISGTHSKQGLKEKIEKRVRSMGHNIETRLTGGAGDAYTFSKEASENGFDAVMACGGDGTVNEIASGLINSDTALIILPNGSGNGLARHIGIPVDPIIALSVLKRGHVVDCDYCTVNGKPFFCTFGVGFDAAVSHHFAKKRSRGLITYLKSALDVYLRFKPEKYRLTVNGNSQDVNCFLIACCNASQYGNNAFIAPTASITDGQLDITLVHSGNPIAQVFVGVELLAGLIAKGGLIDTFRTDKVIIERQNPGRVHIDGEPLDMPVRLDVECHRGGLKIYAPIKTSRIMPFITPAELFLRDCGTALRSLITTLHFPNKPR